MIWEVYGLLSFLHTPKGEPMKKFLIALAALASFSGFAQAQETIKVLSTQELAMFANYLQAQNHVVFALASLLLFMKPI